MHNYETSDVLQHYGVPGMKWGVRKDRRSGSSSSTKRRSKRNSAPDKGTTVKQTVKTHVSKGANFVKENKTAIIVAGLSAATIATGHGYLGPFVGLAVGAVTGNANEENQQRR